MTIPDWENKLRDRAIDLIIKELDKRKNDASYIDNAEIDNP